MVQNHGGEACCEACARGEECEDEEPVHNAFNPAQARQQGQFAGGGAGAAGKSPNGLPGAATPQQQLLDAIQDQFTPGMAGDKSYQGMNTPEDEDVTKEKQEKAGKGKKAENSNPEGHNQYTAGSAMGTTRTALGQAAVEASRKALEQSGNEMDEKSYSHQKAVSADRLAKAGYHGGATLEHDSAALGAIRAGKVSLGHTHQQAADLHKKAMYEAGVTNRYDGEPAAQSRHGETGEYLHKNGRAGTKQVQRHAEVGYHDEDEEVPEMLKDELTSNVWSEEAREAAIEARRASSRAGRATEHADGGRAFGPGGGGLAHSAMAEGEARSALKTEGGASAVSKHFKAAKEHTDAIHYHAQQAMHASADGDRAASRAHERAADLHEAAMKAHHTAASSAMARNESVHDNSPSHLRDAAERVGILDERTPMYGPISNEDFDSLPESAKRAAFAHMSGGGEGPSATAGRASKNAQDKGTKTSHVRAAAAHRAAASHHKEEGNDEKQQIHSAAARYHSAKARTLNEYTDGIHNSSQEEPMLTTHQREAVIERLVANHGHTRGDRALVESLSDEMLVSLMRNAKSDSSFSDRLGDEATRSRMGEKEDVEDGEYDNPHGVDDDISPISSKVKKGKLPANPLATKDKELPLGNRRQARTPAEWMAEAPIEVRNATQNYMRWEGQQITGMRAKLTEIAGSEVDPTKRQMISNMLKRDNPGMSLQELQDLYTLVRPSPRGSLAANMEQTPMYGAPVGNANFQPLEDRDDVLPLPQMTYNDSPMDDEECDDDDDDDRRADNRRRHRA